PEPIRPSQPWCRPSRRRRNPSRSARRASSARTASARGSRSTGSRASVAEPRDRRERVKTLGIVLVLAASLAAVFAGSAQAAYVHTNVTGEYGKEGNAKLGGVGSGCRLAYQSANHR